MKVTWFLILALLILVLTSCVGQEEHHGLRVVAQGAPKTLDPHAVADAISAEYVMEIFDGLVRIEPDCGPCPDLAETWEVSQGQTLYTFHLNRDAKFHNGKPVTAHDFKNSIERATAPQIASPLAKIYLRDIVGVDEKLAGEAKEVDGISVKDEFTLTIRIKNASASFLLKLATPPAFVVDLEDVQRGPNWWTAPNGTGPFRVKQFIFRDRMVLEANPEYHLGAPKLREPVIYEFLRTPNDPMAFEMGEVDIVYLDDLQAKFLLFEDDPRVAQMQDCPRASTIAIMFNTQMPPFDDPKVRRAFALAIDKQAIADWFCGAVTLADRITPPVVPNYMPCVDRMRYDPVRARQLLAESRYADNLPRIVLSQAGILVIELAGDGANVPVAGINPASQTTYHISEMIAWMWKENLGVKVFFHVEDLAVFRERVRAKDLQVILAQWEADYPEPEIVLHDFLYVPFHSGSTDNWSNYSNSAVDKLLRVSHRGQDVASQLKAYEKVEEIVTRDVVWIPLVHLKTNVLVKAGIEGWHARLRPIPQLRQVSIH